MPLHALPHSARFHSESVCQEAMMGVDGVRRDKASQIFFDHISMIFDHINRVADRLSHLCDFGVLPIED